MTLQLLDSDATIEKKIYYSIMQHLLAAIKKSADQIELDVSQNLKRVFLSSPVYQSLTTGGQLSADLGIPGDVAIRWLDKVINVLSLGLKVKVYPVNFRTPQVTIPMQIYIPSSVIDDIINLPESSYMSNGYLIEWMNWLLTKGTEIVVTDFYIQYGNYSRFPGSRTGLAIMIENEGEVWRVDKFFSGTRDDNWITRAIEDNKDYIEKLIFASVTRNIEKYI